MNVNFIRGAQSGSPLKTRDVCATAFHEAGHAVVCCLVRPVLGWDLAICTIEPNDKFLGHVRHSLGYLACHHLKEWPPAISLLQVELYVQMLLAGGAAESMYSELSYRPGHSKRDHKEAREALRLIVRQPEIDHFMFSNLASVMKLLGGVWEAVRSVAFWLLQKGTLSGREVEMIVDRALDRLSRATAFKKQEKTL